MKIKEEIIRFNEQFGIKTIFCNLGDVLGYSENNTIYLNENADNFQKINNHELLHFFEDTETFIELKEKILKDNKDKIDLIREQYELRYAGLYSKEDIKNGIIDIEIVIDILTDNYIIEFKDGLKVGEYLLGSIKKELEEKRYLNLIIRKNVEQMDLSKWEKLFVNNFYDGKNHILPQKENRYEQIRKDIEEELERLYSLINDKEEFRINANSKEILREYESEIKALQQRGEDTSYLESRKEYCLNELAEKFSNHLYEEYKHIVDFIKNTNYEPAFKVLMLNETLTKTYKLDKVEDKTNTIIKKRDMHNTITGHMTLNETVLDTIYNNIDDYNNFALIYFAGLEIFNKSIAQTSGIKLDGVQTYKKGKWLKFEGKTSNEKEYIANAEKLASLVKDTPWCTKTLASTQLAQGDFFVFVDNEDKPHIAVKMSGNEIDEVRGILNDNAQEIEEEYRDVTLSFLENNKGIKNGKEWLEKEELNKRLIKYNNEIESSTFESKNIEQMLDDLIKDDYKNHGHGENTNKTKLKNNLHKIKDKIAKYYNCTEEEVFIGDIDFSKTDYIKYPYKIILGTAYYAGSKITDLGNLKIIIGDANFRGSQLTNLGNLQTIGGYAHFRGSQVTDLGNLQRIGGYAYFGGSQVTDLGNLQTIGGNADFGGSQVTDLGNLQTIGGYADFRGSQVADLGNLQTIGGNAYFGGSQVADLGNLQTIGGDAAFGDSKLTNLGNLQTIGGYAYFGGSQVADLGNLQRIEGEVFFDSGSELKKLYCEQFENGVRKNIIEEDVSMKR